MSNKGAVLHHARGARKQPISLNRPFPLLNGLFSDLSRPFPPKALLGRFPSQKSGGKNSP